MPRRFFLCWEPFSDWLQIEFTNYGHIIYPFFSNLFQSLLNSIALGSHSVVKRRYSNLIFPLVNIVSVRKCLWFSYPAIGFSSLQMWFTTAWLLNQFTFWYWSEIFEKAELHLVNVIFLFFFGLINNWFVFWIWDGENIIVPTMALSKKLWDHLQDSCLKLDILQCCIRL